MKVDKNTIKRLKAWLEKYYNYAEVTWYENTASLGICFEAEASISGWVSVDSGPMRGSETETSAEVVVGFYETYKDEQITDLIKEMEEDE